MPRVFGLVLLLISSLSAAASSIEAATQRARTELAARLGIEDNAITTVSAESLVWRDASMGCGKPKESYAQIEVSGYRIVLEYHGERFDYRVREDGVFVLCDAALKRR